MVPIVNDTLGLAIRIFDDIIILIDDLISDFHFRVKDGRRHTGSRAAKVSLFPCSVARRMKTVTISS